MDDFTPLSATAGGALIGLSAIALMLTHGRIAGISTLFAGLMSPRPGDTAWRLAFVGGLIGAGTVLAALRPAFFTTDLDRSPVSMVIAGLLVGFGTRMAGGCTSGHGVCGIGRLSRRSILATITFMATGGLTVWALRAWFGGAI